jgi:protein-S-isoprenylcysteine O-methyltransferase Ste14
MLIAFGVLTFGVRVALQLRRTGRTGLIGFRRGGPLAWLSAILFTGGMAMGVVSVDHVERSSLATIDALDSTPLHVIGVAVAAAAGLAVFGAQVGMGESWRIGVSEEERTRLITGGWFSWVRNPIYTSMIIGWLGIALMVPTRLGFGAVIAIAVGLELQVRAVEEPYLIRTHAEAYGRYAARVGRFIPGVGRLSG